LIDRTETAPPAAPRPILARRWTPLFFIAWTALAVLAVSLWLQRQPGSGFVIDDNSKVSFAQRIGNWLKLADFNFHGIYPWLLLAPYALWLGSRFPLERARWKWSLPLHASACVIFAFAAKELADVLNAPSRHVVVVYGVESTQSGTNGTHVEKFTVITNTSGAPLPMLPPKLGAFAGAFGEGHSLSVRAGVSDSFSQLLNVLAYAALVGVAQSVHFYRRLRERERQALLLESQLTQARLRALQAQLHPHFLFNALNGISTLLRRDPRMAQDALASFSELLRLALNQSAQPEVTLRDDLEFLRRYVEVQQMRLGDRLRFEESIPEALADCVVPALLLQPLVENSLRHGIEPSPNPGFVRVAARQTDNYILLTVEDNGLGLSNGKPAANSGGLGLENLRARLRSLYGERQRLEVSERPGGGALVEIQIPLRRGASLNPQ